MEIENFPLATSQCINRSFVDSPSFVHVMVGLVFDLAFFYVRGPERKEKVREKAPR